MRNHRFHPVAFLLAVAAHLGFSLALGGSTEKEVLSNPAETRGVIVTRLDTMVGAGTANQASHVVDTVPSSDAGSDNIPSEPNGTRYDFSATDAKKPSEDATTIPKDATTIPIMAEPYYFQSDELTEKPRLLLDIPPDKISDLPDMSPSPAIARLLISEHGDIDKVLIENSSLSEKAKQFVIDSFSNVKFQPGKLGDMPVRSELRIEILLKSTTPATVSVVH